MKYTKELLEQIAPRVLSYAALARELGIAPIGSNTTNLSKRCKQYNIDTSHFTGQLHSKGRPSRNRKEWMDILVERTREQGRETVSRLRRAMMEAGILYVCCKCGLADVWNNQPLTLQIEHKNGKYWDNTLNNVCFICPNCHTQTDTWGSRNKGLVA